MTASRSTISAPLLGWYDRHARVLPWRALPGAAKPDPYRVWLSEVMLQQTTVGAVKPYFARFVEKWPDVEALAAAPEEAVMAAWAGLGYYSRARNLVKCARAVAERGGFPDTEAELRQLPGLGDYTAAAVAAIGFGRRAVVVDANVERVVARLFAIGEPLARARKAIRVRTAEITPDERSGDFAQAMMDLGATICTPREPKCLLCPVAELCEARTTGEPARFPVRTPKKRKPVRQGCCYWVSDGTNVWLVRRLPEGMLGGMRALPDDGWNARSDGSGEPPLAGEWVHRGTVRHSFTHFAIELAVMELLGSPHGSLPAGEWWPVAELASAGLPTLFAKAVQRVVSAG